MAMILKWFSLYLFLMLHCLNAEGDVVDTESRWTLNFARSMDAKVCTKETRVAADLCFHKVAKNDEEKEACARIFVNSYPKCFFSSHEQESLTESGECRKYCWEHYGKCMGYSKPGGEQFTCRNFRRKCNKACSKTVTKRSSIEMLRSEVDKLLRQRELKSVGEGKGDKNVASTIYKLVSLIKSRREKLAEDSLRKASLRELSKLGSRRGSLHAVELREADSELSTRSVECDSNCQGHYDACLTLVQVVADHVVCLEAKDQCMKIC